MCSSATAQQERITGSVLLDPTSAVDPAFVALLTSWRRHLAAENKAPRTLETYTEALTAFGRFLAGRGMPSDPASIAREHVEEFIAHLLQHFKPATAANRYRALGTFFRWLAEEGEIPVSPMAKMRPPTVPEEPPPVLSDADLSRLLKTCSGTAFADRRDLAIVLLLLDTGMRLAELHGLTLDDLDLEINVARVMGKGRRPRACPFGKKTARALDRYLRARARHRDADRPELWLGKAGPMTDSGVYQVVRDRSRQAGIGHVHPHQLRHNIRARLARRRWQRGRPDASYRLALEGDGQPVRSQRRRRASAGGPQAAQSRRPTMNAASQVTPCRWKHLYGLGREAVYRATCGRESCPGHLGDLRYTDSLANRTASDLQARRYFEDLVRSGALPGVLTPEQAEARQRETELIASQVEHMDLSQDGEWRMSAEPLSMKRDPSTRYPTLIGPGGYAFYRGYADSGFRISLSGKRSRKGWHIARRPMQGVSRDLRIPGVSVKFIEGQVVRPTDRVCCRVCGQLNQLGWPDGLKDPEAR